MRKQSDLKTLGSFGKLMLVNTTLLSLFGANSVTQFLPVYAATHNTTGNQTSKQNTQNSKGAGNLLAISTSGTPVGECPLKHTSVSTKVSGYVARVTVKQSFSNPFKNKIEAIYTFPLSESGAVDSMTMKVGSRTIKGTIKKREEAKQIYETAKAQGHVASLLDQERTNIFTQSVANIEPGATVDITLTYVELLKYDAGKFSYTFPTVVGPRFIPGDATGKEGTGWAPDTTSVPDASKITPPVTPENTRSGHDISIDVDVDAGVPIQNISSKLHEITLTKVSNNESKVKLKDANTIPNKDFVLSWDVAGDALKSGYLTHRESKSESGYFTLMLLPPKRVTPEKVAPKEMIFLIDCSGSQNGAPLQKAKETLSYIVDHMNPQDTFQIIAFGHQSRTLYDKPQPVTGARKVEANKFIDELRANGGTWMAPAVEKACSTPPDEHRLRIVTFMTDGFVGNDLEILGMIKKNRAKSRWFSFGTGNSVNRMLIDGIAAEGGGEADYVLLNSSGQEVGKKFYDRISSPVLTDVKVDFGKLDVKEVFPRDVSDVWAEKPLYIKGRYLTPGAGTVTLTGYAGGKPYTQTLSVNFPEVNKQNEVLGSVWARAKVDRLQSEDYQGAQSGKLNSELKDEIIKTALEHHIMTNYTSFVAVEEKTVTKDGVMQTVTVPVELPDGVDRASVFGEPAPMSPRVRAGGGGAGAPLGYAGPMRMLAKQAHYQHYNAGMASADASKGLMQNQAAMMPPPLASAKPKSRDMESSLSSPREEVAQKEETKKDSGTRSIKLDYNLRMLLEAKELGKALPQLKGCDGTFVAVSVEVSDTADEVIQKLKNAGFEIAKQSGKKFFGRIKIQDLRRLAELASVTHIKASEP